MPRATIAILADQPAWVASPIISYVYGEDRLARIRQLGELHPVLLTSQNLAQESSQLADVEILFSTWGMPKLTEAELDRLPKLKVVFYASGSVTKFADPLIQRGITICSAVEANAIPVAEFCFAQIVLGAKNYFANTRRCGQGTWQSAVTPCRGVYGETVALLGVGAISRHLLTLLKSVHLRVVAVSNYLAARPEAEVKALGIDRLVSLEEAFQVGYIVSNHLPDKRSNQGVITGAHFASMRPDAVFINTGRGAQVDEAGMIEVLKRRTDLTALLDVQHPEPPLPGSPLFDLPNIHLSAHIAGSMGDEVRRMADMMIEEAGRWLAGQPLRYRVDPAELVVRA